MASTLPTPPDSPGKRRRILRDSDDAAGTMSIERYIYCSDPFRSTTVYAPLPLPLHHLTPPSNISDRIIPLRTQIRGIMESHSIKDPYEADLCFLRKPDYPDTSIPRLTLYIRFHGSKIPESWGDIRDALHHLLSRTELATTEVDIVDADSAFVPMFLPIKPGSGSILLFESVQEQLVRVLHDRVPRLWTSLGIVNVGRNIQAATPKVIVLVHPKATHDWQTLVYKFQSIINPKLPKGQNLEVEIIPGSTSDAVGGIPLRDVPLCPTFGSSIGLTRENGSGTLGGFVNLVTGGLNYPGFLTCHHVIQPAENAPKATQEKARKGYKFSLHGQSDAPTLQYPSQDDLKATVIANKEDIERQKAAIAEQQETIMRYEMGGRPVTNYTRSMLEGAEATLKGSRDKEAVLAKLPVRIGKVLVSSGRRVNSILTRIDWAFVGLAQPLHSSLLLNQLPSISHPGLEGRLPQDYGLNQQYLVPANGIPLYAQEFSSIEKGKWYFKIGRTTRLTVGICHGTEQIINQLGNTFIDDQEADIVPVFTKELVIISYDPKPGPQVKYNQKTFCSMGDSGSFIIDSSGRVAGMLHGYIHGAVGEGNADTVHMNNAGLVTCMTNILPSIATCAAAKDASGKIGKAHFELPTK